MQAQQCPICKLLSPSDATSCDCSYSFIDESTKPTARVSKPELSTGGRVWRILLGVVVVGAPLRFADSTDAPLAVWVVCTLISASLAWAIWHFL